MNPENPRKIILNIEATGASVDDGHRIIELAAVEMIDGRFTYRAYRTLLNPEHPIDEGAQAIHGISDDALEGAPSFDEIATELSEFLRGATARRTPKASAHAGGTGLCAHQSRPAEDTHRCERRAGAVW